VFSWRDQNKTKITIPDFIIFMYHGHILWLLLEKNQALTNEVLTYSLTKGKEH